MLNIKNLKKSSKSVQLVGLKLLVDGFVSESIYEHGLSEGSLNGCNDKHYVHGLENTSNILLQDILLHSFDSDLKDYNVQSFLPLVAELQNRTTSSGQEAIIDVYTFVRKVFEDTFYGGE